jgi:carboxyl-terminal processing protease
VADAVDLANLFIQHGLLTQVATRVRTQAIEANPIVFASQAANLTIVVLVSGNTAAAAEVVADALRHHRHAKLIGAKTAGADALYAMYAGPMPYAVFLLIGRLVAIDGTSLANGITPDLCTTGGGSWQTFTDETAERCQETNESDVPVLLKQLGRNPTLAP